MTQPWHLRPKLEQFIDYVSPMLEKPDYPDYEASESFAMNRLLGNMSNLELAEDDLHHLQWRDLALRSAAAPYDLPVSVLKYAHEKRIEHGHVEERGYKVPSEAAYLSDEWRDRVMSDPTLVAAPFSRVDEARWRIKFPGYMLGSKLTPEQYKDLSPDWRTKIRAEYKHSIEKAAMEEAARAHEAAARAGRELEEAKKRAAAGALMETSPGPLASMAKGLTNAAISSIVSGASAAASAAARLPGSSVEFGKDVKAVLGLRFKSPEAPDTGAASTSALDLRPASYSAPSQPGTTLLGGEEGFHPMEMERAMFVGSLGMHNMPEIIHRPFRERAQYMSHVLFNLQKSEELHEALRSDIFGILWKGLAEQQGVPRSHVPELRQLFERDVSKMTTNARSVFLLRRLLHMYEDVFDLHGETTERSSMQLQSGQRLMGAIENMASSAQYALEATRSLQDEGLLRESYDPEPEDLSKDDMVAMLQARISMQQTDRDYQEQAMRETAAIITSGASSSSMPDPISVPIDLPTDRDFTDYRDPRLIAVTPAVPSPFGNQRPDQNYANIQAMADAELNPQPRILQTSDDSRRTYF